MTKSYIDSHTGPGKGVAYDHAYQTNSWYRYLWSVEQSILNSILDRYFPNTPVDLLDFACGTGRITAALETRVHSATGVDVSETMLEVAQQKLQHTKLYKGNLLTQNLFPGRRFNLITAFRFFVNAEPELRISAIRVLETYLADDGILVFNNHQNYDAFYTQVTRAYALLRHSRPANTLSIAQCRELLASVNMEIDRIYPAGLIHFPRIDLPAALYRAADTVAGWSQFLARHTESPIVVARRRTRSRENGERAA